MSRNEHDEEKILECNNCDAVININTESCPVMSDDLGKKGISHNYFCLSCCKDFFEDGDCNGECEQEFITKHRQKIFETVCKKFELIKEVYGTKRGELSHFTEKNCSVYINNDKSFAIGYGEENKKFFEKIDFDDFEDYNIEYEGQETLFIKFKDKIIGFNKEKINLIKHITDIFEREARTSDFYHDFKTNGELLLIQHYELWFILAPVDLKYLTETEQQHYIDNTTSGLNFFKLDVSEKIDWSKITDSEFEELIADLIKEEENIDNVKLFGGKGGDSKRDIVCDERIKNIFGMTTEKLVIECKKHISSVNPSKICDVIKFNSIHKANKYLFVVSSSFTNPAKDLITSWNNDDRYPFYVGYWEGRDIEKRLSKYPDLIMKYFGKR